MGIIKRFKDIMSANVTALLDRLEDPEKMLDQYLAEVERDLFKVKRETAAVLAEEKRAERERDNCKKEIASLEEYAKLALKKNEENDAIEFLVKKKEKEERLKELEAIYAGAVENSNKMKQLHDKLSVDYSSLKTKQQTLKAKAKVAKTRQNMNGLVSSSENYVANNIRNFNRMEQKINDAMDRVDAAEELEKMTDAGTLRPLIEKYIEDSKRLSVMEELEQLKKAVGV